MNGQISARTRPYSPRKFTSRQKAAFRRERTAALIQHLGRDPSYPELILLSRIIAVEWELRRTDALIDAGQEPSGHMLRARLAAENRLRLDLLAIGLRPAAARPPTLQEHLARRAAERGETA